MKRILFLASAILVYIHALDFLKTSRPVLLRLAQLATLAAHRAPRADHVLVIALWLFAGSCLLWAVTHG